MTDPFKRGSAPGRERAEYERPGTFKQGHEKRGGRKPGTPNAFSADYRRAVLEAAYRVGQDGNGKDGLIGYLRWVARHHPAIYCGALLVNLLPLEYVGDAALDQPRRTKAEINEWVREYVGLTRKNRTKRQIKIEAGSPWDWTGQDFPVGPLMHTTIADPKGFCQLLAAAFLRPPTRSQRGLAQRRA